MRFPERGRASADVLTELKGFAAGDADWRQGRVPLYVFKATDEAADVGRDAFFAYFTENALGSKRAFASLKRMEDEVVAMALDLFQAPAGAPAGAAATRPIAATSCCPPARIRPSTRRRC
jgi:sphinganine-1-phosphate aldolase